MSNQREVIAVCGCWLYEEKENAFISELVTQCKEQDYVVAAFNFSADPMEGVAEISRETRLLDIIEETECVAVVIMDYFEHSHAASGKREDAKEGNTCFFT